MNYRQAVVGADPQKALAVKRQRRDVAVNGAGNRRVVLQLYDIVLAHEPVAAQRLDPKTNQKKKENKRMEREEKKEG